jgi:hypothetical protein
MRASHETPLRFATFLAPNLLPVYRFLAQRIAHHLGRPVQIIDQFERGEAHLGVICGLPYVWLAARRPRPVQPRPPRCWPESVMAAARSTTPT